MRRSLLRWSLFLGLLIAPGIIAAQTIIDLTTTEDFDFHNGARFNQGDGGSSSGTGLFDPFVRIKDNSDLVAGVNTGHTTVQFETEKGTWTTELLLSTVTQINVEGTLFREFFLDINQTKGNAIYDMIDVQLYTDNQPDLNCLDPATRAWSTCDDAAPADLIYWLDGAPDGDALVRMNYNLEAGSGKRDVRMLIPDAVFNAGPECDYGQQGCGLYVYLYSQFTPNDDGFEEWSTAIQPFIQISKDATGTLHEDTDWTITKTVNIGSWSLFDGDTGTSKYTITLDKTVTQSDVQVTGSITMSVPDKLPDGDENAATATVQTLTDVYEGIAASSITCTAGAPPFDIDPGDTVTCDYVIDLVSEVLGTNTATAEVLDRDNAPRPYVATAVVGSFSVNAVGEPGTVNVTDSNGQTFGPFSDDATEMYEVTFDCDDEGPNPNTASINETGDSDDASVSVTCYTPTVAKTVETSKTINYTWTIDKSVTPDSWDLFTGDTGTSDYTIDVTRSSTASGFMVDGDITVTNPHPTRALDLTNVADVITPGDIAATVDCGGATSVAADDDLVCSYTVALTEEQAGAATTNTATATYQNTAFDSSGGSSLGGTTDVDDDETVDFSNVTNVIEIDKTATVTDDWATPGDDADDATWNFGGDGQQTYSLTFACDDDEGDRTNTATIVGDDTATEFDSDDATVSVACHQLTVQKDAETSFTREWDWDIAKTGFTFGTTEPVTSVTLMLGQTYQVRYDIEAKLAATEFTDSDWAVSGAIAVANPAPIDAVINDVGDLITAGDIDGSPDCGVTFPHTLPAGETLNCTYAADLPDASDRTNTATATQQNYAYASDGTASDNGTTDYSGKADVAFGDPTTLVDECATVNDPMAPDGTFPVEVCASDAPETTSYSHTIRFVGAEFCGPQRVMNTATITEEDTEESDTALWTIDVLIECLEGCTLTQGYWKTHSELGPAPYDDNWANLLDPLAGPGTSGTCDDGANGACTPFVDSNDMTALTWREMFWTPPRRGDDYVKLAHQWMAAYLNVLNEADGSAVATEMAQAEALLRDNSARWDGGPLRNRRMNRLAGTLASYNEGDIGPGHCDEDASSNGVTESAASARLAAADGDESPDALAASDEEAVTGETDAEVDEATAEDAAEAPAAEARVTEAVPEAFAVSANYPNPFDRTTTIRVDLPEAAAVRLTVMDPLGREIAVLANATLDAGVHRFTWDAGALPSGTYFYAVQSGTDRSVQSMVLVR